MNAFNIITSYVAIFCSVVFCSATIRAQNYYQGGGTYRSAYPSRPVYSNGRSVNQYRYARPSSVLGQRRVTNYRPIRQATPGQHRIWKQAEGTSAVGYTAPDGSCWKLLQVKGTYVIDASGRRRRISSTSATGSNQYVWKIERPQQATRNAWICRDPDTESLSILYRRPVSSKLKFYSAVVTLDAAKKITNLRWNETPIWADSVTFVKPSTIPALPRRSYRPTSQSFVTATYADLQAARRVFQPATRTLNLRAARQYEQDSSTAAVQQWRQMMQQERSGTAVPPIPNLPR